IGGDPNVFISLCNPKRGTTAKYSGFPIPIALHPVRVIFEECVFGLIRICRDTFQTGNVNERLVADGMSCLRGLLDRSELGRRVEKAFIAAGHVIIDFNAEHMARLRFPDDVRNTLMRQAMPCNADVMSPILYLRLLGGVG